jgi:hypothetical protein
MSENTTPPPVARDRPYVDGTASTSAELTAAVAEEVAELDDELRQDIEARRAEVGDTVAELATRLDVPARVRAGREDVAAAVRARTRTAGSTARRAAGQARSTASERPAVVGAAVLAVLVVLLARRRSVRRREHF